MIHENLIAFDSVSKVYPSDPKSKKVIDNITFNISRGECVGLVGKNGSGKSTILKIIAGVSKISSGHATMKGRILPMLEVGTGFNPELSCKDNVIFYNALIGLDHIISQEKLLSIFEFAELVGEEKKPVKYLSSGQYMRLAFSVAISQQPDIILIDEVLAVGDQGFQKKCISKIMELKQTSSIVFVSHNLAQVQLVCDRCILIDEAKIVFDGDVAIGLNIYNKQILGV